uniref:Uncharacterized protein n=1 Tax=Heterorhabditis bacteriophora TaxID=37862 RepID=A0A1I7WNF8_HETBA
MKSCKRWCFFSFRQGLVRSHIERELHHRSEESNECTFLYDNSNLRCMIDDKHLLLLDDSNVIIVRSRMLWNVVFHTLNVKSFFRVAKPIAKMARWRHGTSVQQNNRVSKKSMTPGITSSSFYFYLMGAYLWQGASSHP